MYAKTLISSSRAFLRFLEAWKLHTGLKSIGKSLVNSGLSKVFHAPQSFSISKLFKYQVRINPVHVIKQNIMSTAFDRLPIIDLAPLQNPHVSQEKLQELAATVRHTFETVGFAYLVNHNVNLNHKELFDTAKEFFSMPQEEKSRLAKKTFVPENSNTYRGYFPVQKNDTSYKEGLYWQMDGCHPIQITDCILLLSFFDQYRI